MAPAAVAVPQASSAPVVAPPRVPQREPPVFETRKSTPHNFPPPPLKAQLEDIPMNASPLRVVLPVALALGLALGGYFGLSRYYRGKTAASAASSAASTSATSVGLTGASAIAPPPVSAAVASVTTPQPSAAASADPPPKPSAAIVPRPWKPGGRKPRAPHGASASTTASPPPDPPPPPPTATIPTPITPPGEPVPP